MVDGKYPCSVCGDALGHRAYVLQHMIVHTKSELEKAGFNMEMVKDQAQEAHEWITARKARNIEGVRASRENMKRTNVKKADDK